MYSGVARTLRPSVSTRSVCRTPVRTSPLRTALHWSATPDTCFYERQLRSAQYSLITVSVDFHFLFSALPAHSPRGSRQGLCNSRAVCQSRHSPAARRFCRFAAERPADSRYRSTAARRVCSRCAVQRRSAANAGSATLTAYVGS